MSELQLTAPANAGVQKAESVCKSWRLSVSELHTYFVEKRYTESVADRIVKDLLRLPCPSGYNSFARKLICLGGRSEPPLFKSSFWNPICQQQSLKTKRLLRLFSGVWLVCPIAPTLRRPPKKTSVFIYLAYGLSPLPLRKIGRFMFWHFGKSCHDGGQYCSTVPAWRVLSA